jgi:hypothetical protein
MRHSLSPLLCGLLLLALMPGGCKSPPSNSTSRNKTAQPMKPATTQPMATPADMTMAATDRTATQPLPLGPVLFEGLRTNMTRPQVRAHTGLSVETAAQCAAWCQDRDECCGPKIVAGFHGVSGPNPRSVYLRGKVAGLPIRVTTDFRKNGGLFHIAALFTKYREEKPILKTPMGAYALKLFGTPSKARPSGNAVRWKTAWGWVLLIKSDAMRGCRCPKGSKCNCRAKRWVEYRLVVKANHG